MNRDTALLNLASCFSYNLDYTSAVNSLANPRLTLNFFHMKITSIDIGISASSN